MNRPHHLRWLRRQRRWEHRLLLVYELATSSQIADGLAWYPAAQERLAELAPTWSIEKRAAVCAILSPRITWKENQVAFRKLYVAACNGLSVVPVCAGLNRNIAKAYAVATDELDVSAATGPKVSAFYHNLCGNYEYVTVDTWAARAVGLKDGVKLEDNRHRYLVNAYRNVAHELGLAPAAFQAMVWIVVRETGE